MKGLSQTQAVQLLKSGKIWNDKDQKNYCPVFRIAELTFWSLQMFELYQSLQFKELID